MHAFIIYIYLSDAWYYELVLFYLIDSQTRPPENLRKKSQRVYVRIIMSGMPQGTVCSPLPFIMMDKTLRVSEVNVGK